MKQRQAFNPGDRVSWPSRWGWQSGTIVSVDPAKFTTVFGIVLKTVQLTIRDAGGDIITRYIGGCAASIPGPHVVPAAKEAA